MISIVFCTSLPISSSFRPRDRTLSLFLSLSISAYILLFTWCACRCCHSMHHKKKHEIRHQSVPTPSPLHHHHRLATRFSTLKLTKSSKVKRLIQTSTSKNGISFSFFFLISTCFSDHVRLRSIRNIHTYIYVCLFSFN